MRFVTTDQRLDVLFEEDKTPFDVAATLLALCAHPAHDPRDEYRQARKFWEALYFITVRGNKAVHPTAGRPERRPARRDALAALEKGFDRIAIFSELNSGLRMYWASNGVIGLAPSRDMKRLTIIFTLDDKDRLIAGKAPAKPSLTEFLRRHQPVVGRGRDEEGTAERENAKTLRKRVVSPMLRVAHILTPLRGHILETAKEGAGPWPRQLLRQDPAWVLRVIERSRLLAPIEAQLARQNGIRSAHVDRMVHFHLPRHLQILPPPKSPAA